MAWDYGLHAEIIENIDIETLKRLIKDGYPVIALLDPAIFYGGAKGFGHFVVVVDCDDSLIYYHDPELESEKVISNKSSLSPVFKESSTWTTPEPFS